MSETLKSQLLKIIEMRAELLQAIRRYFSSTSATEVDVPVIGATAVTDPHLDSIAVSYTEQRGFLQTSPEFFMKRLLSQGCGDIFYLGKAFRQDELGPRHNPEFTMLEWYRVGLDDQQLMDDVKALILNLRPGALVHKRSYRDVFELLFQKNPHTISLDELRKLANEHVEGHFDGMTKSDWLDLLFSHVIEPSLQELTFIYDYPECQRALARVEFDRSGHEVARRFELYWKGIELANGYWELTDAGEQLRRFEDDKRRRKLLGKQDVVIDQNFIQALESGLPECAGVALGLDRLLMCLHGKGSIAEVMPFPVSRL